MVLITQSELRSFLPIKYLATPESPMIRRGAGQAIKGSSTELSLPRLEEESGPPVRRSGSMTSLGSNGSSS
eukprot:13293570-Heterocapsa_arctica.AAC.1